jgi:hypothetical protein
MIIPILMLAFGLYSLYSMYEGNAPQAGLLFLRGFDLH